MSQIALPLDVRGATGPVRIAVGEGNRGAIEGLADAASWPFRTAVLVGPPRSGKSLLAGWFAASGAGEVVDDAHRVDETALFHAWNRAQETERPLLLAARPGWQVALPDLASRLAGSLQLAIGSPGDALVAELHQMLHTIAGSAATFGFRVLGQQARQLEQRLRVLMAFETVSPQDWENWMAGLDQYVAWAEINPKADLYP